MRYRDWIFLLALSGLGMALANYIGAGRAFGESLPGILILLGISLAAVALDRVTAIRLPIIAYCSLIGLLLACPWSPVAGHVIDAANKINFTAPLTMVGSFAGMSISNQLRIFVRQGWKMLFIALLVMTGTFVGSLLIAQFVLELTGTI